MDLPEYRQCVGRIPFGKRLPTAVYVNRGGLSSPSRSGYPGSTQQFATAGDIARPSARKHPSNARMHFLLRD